MFRDTLVQAKVVESLLAQFETYLAEHGLQPRGGKLIEAPLIPVPKPRNSPDENATIKAGTCPPAWERHPDKRRQQDTEARWRETGREAAVDPNHWAENLGCSVKPSAVYFFQRKEQKMAKRSRRNHSPAFKAKVALAAVRGSRTLAE